MKKLASTLLALMTLSVVVPLSQADARTVVIQRPGVTRFHTYGQLRRHTRRMIRQNRRLMRRGNLYVVR